MTMTGYHNIHVGPIAMRPVGDVNNGHTHIYIYVISNLSLLNLDSC